MNERLFPIEKLCEVFSVANGRDVVWKTPSGYRTKEGDVAGTMAGGYRIVNYMGKTIQAHRIAFVLYHNRYPDGIIDHVNGIKDDNSVYNLRESTKTENAKNKSVFSCSTTGVPGVSWYKARKNWEVTICGLRLGYVKDFHDAVMIRWNSEDKHGITSRNRESFAARYGSAMDVI